MREPADQPSPGENSNGADRSRSEAERAQRATARQRKGAFGNAVITADVRDDPVTTRYR